MTRRAGEPAAAAAPGGRHRRAVALLIALAAVGGLAATLRWPDLARAWWERQGLDAVHAAAQAQPADPVRAVVAARRLLAADRAEDARRVLAALPEPLSPEARRLHVTALVECGRMEEAVAAVGDPDPTDADALCAAALVWSRVGRAAAARELLPEVVKLRPVFPEAWLLLGELRLDIGDEEAALPALDRAVAQNAGARALVLRSLIHLGAGRLAEAERDARAGVAAGGSPEARTMLGQVLLQGGRPEAQDEALAQLEQALAVKPDHPRTLSLAARAYRERGRHADAVRALRRRLRSPAASPAPYLLLGQAYQALGETKRADAVFRLHARLQREWDTLNRLELRAQGGRDAARWRTLVEACVRAGWGERARRHLTSGVARCGRHPTLTSLEPRAAAAPDAPTPPLPADPERDPG